MELTVATILVALTGVLRISFMRGAFDGGFAIVGIPLLSVWHVSGDFRVRAAPRSNAPFVDPTQPRQGVYWTPRGRRLLQPVNGVCPARYGEKGAREWCAAMARPLDHFSGQAPPAGTLH
jgi:hypothetical protein